MENYTSILVDRNVWVHLSKLFLDSVSVAFAVANMSRKATSIVLIKIFNNAHYFPSKYSFKYRIPTLFSTLLYLYARNKIVKTNNQQNRNF